MMNTVSFDLAALAMDDTADSVAASAMFDRCTAGSHDDGDPDGRIVAFYERLTARFPDHGPVEADSPWTAMPLNIGIDHVIMHLTWSDLSTPAAGSSPGSGSWPARSSWRRCRYSVGRVPPAFAWTRRRTGVVARSLDT